MTTPQNEEQRPAQAEREELTKEERARLSGGADWSAGEHAGRKALRIIDRDAADRAALVARVAGLEREVKRLTCIPCDADKRAAEAEVARLREALAAAERACDAAIAGNTISTQHARDAEHRADDIGRLGKEHIEQLRGLLENEEKNHAFTKSECAKERSELLKQCDLLRGERGAAEARVAELERQCDEHVQGWAEMNERLAAANALLGRIPDCLLTDCPVYADTMAYKRAHLSAQPTAPARSAAEQRVLDACRDAQLTCWDGADGTMSESLRGIIQAELARREEAPRG